MSVLHQLFRSKRQMEKEEKLLNDAGYTKADPTYSLLMAMLKMPGLLIRLVIAAAVAPAISLGAMWLGIFFWWPTGVWIHKTGAGTQIVIAAPKGVEAAWCIDGHSLCVTQKR